MVNKIKLQIAQLLIVENVQNVGKIVILLSFLVFHHQNLSHLKSDFIE